MDEEQLPQQPALPGDIIQVVDQNSPIFLGLLIVQSIERWGVGAQIAFKSGNQLDSRYERLKPEQFVVCGACHLLPTEVLRARKEAARGLKEKD